MKLISPEKQAQVRLRFEVSLAALMSVVLVSVLVLLTDPAFSGTRALLGSGLQSV